MCTCMGDALLVTEWGGKMNACMCDVYMFCTRMIMSLCQLEWSELEQNGSQLRTYMRLILPGEAVHIRTVGVLVYKKHC